MYSYSYSGVFVLLLQFVFIPLLESQSARQASTDECDEKGCAVDCITIISDSRSKGKLEGCCMLLAFECRIRKDIISYSTSYRKWPKHPLILCGFLLLLLRLRFVA